MEESNTNEEKTQAEIRYEVFARARRIPSGRVLSYGELGALCDPPVSGYICGRMLNNVPGDVPWWRVVARDGSLPVSKRSPHLAQDQRARLESEGVGFDDEGRVEIAQFRAVITATPSDESPHRQPSLGLDE